MLRSTNNREIFTVSQLNHVAQRTLEQLGTVWVEGEISNHVRASSGHHYFSLKDASAQVSAALFRSAAARVKFPLQNGAQVLARAKVTLYSPRGNYQIIVEHMEPAGEGKLRQQLEALKAKLMAEGLFAEESKRSLPLYPQRIGIITSPTGAAIEDMRSILTQQCPHIPYTLYPAIVQGPDAPASLRAALSQAIAEDICDVLIIGRGGGSLEDLWGFNDEQLARDVSACPIPIISAVGHEIDFCLTDFVADWRAPTPTAAAEQLARASARLPALLLDWQRRLAQAMAHILRQRQQQQRHLQQRLRHPQQLLQWHAQRTDELHARLLRAQKTRLLQQRQRVAQVAQRLRHPLQNVRQQQHALVVLQRRLAQAVQQRLQQQQQRQAHLQARLASHAPLALLNGQQQRLAAARQRLPQLMQQLLRQQQQQLGFLAQRLQHSSPLNTLARGYSLNTVDGQPMRSVKDVQVGSHFSSRLQDGEITAVVAAITHYDD